MTTTLEIDVFDRTNRLCAALEEAEYANKGRKRYQFAVKRYKQFRAGKGSKGDFCIVRIGSKTSGLEQLRELRQQLDSKHWRGMVAVLSRKLANDTQIQRILLNPGRTNAISFIVDDWVDENPKPVVDHLNDLIDTVGAEEEVEGSKAFHQPYLEASLPIRSPKSHRLDAKRIADYFGLSLRELARILGKSHATVDKTPDSRNLQARLQPFEAILRGRILVGHDDALFRQWLNTACQEFPERDGKVPTPMDIIRMGHPEVVAALVDEALTGEPA